MSSRKRKFRFCRDLEKARRKGNTFTFHLEQKRWCGGKRIQAQIWRKEWNNDHSLDVVHGEIFVVSQQRYRSNFQFWLLLPKCFPLASLTLAFYRAQILWLMLVLKTFNWPDADGANDTYGNTVHHYLRMLRLSMCVSVCVSVSTESLLLTTSKAQSTVVLDTCQLKKITPWRIPLTVRAHSGPQS